MISPRGVVTRAALWAIGCWSARAAAGVYDVSVDFSATRSVGTWSYGWKPSADGVFIPHQATIPGIPYADSSSGTTWFAAEGLTVWIPASASVLDATTVTPHVSHNPLPFSLAFNRESTVLWAPGQVELHPGPEGKWSVVRWTAPAAGDYQVQAQFYNLNSVGATVETRVEWDAGNYSQNGFLDGNLSLSLGAGQTVDFAVGPGPGSVNNYFYDSVGLTAKITAIPEPSVIGLFAAGSVGIGIFRMFRGRSTNSVRIPTQFGH